MPAVTINDTEWRCQEGHVRCTCALPLTFRGQAIPYTSALDVESGIGAIDAVADYLTFRREGWGRYHDVVRQLGSVDGWVPVLYAGHRYQVIRGIAQDMLLNPALCQAKVPGARDGRSLGSFNSHYWKVPS